MPFSGFTSGSEVTRHNSAGGKKGKAIIHKWFDSSPDLTNSGRPYKQA
jgi:hypothetical protein